MISKYSIGPMVNVLRCQPVFSFCSQKNVDNQGWNSQIADMKECSGSMVECLTQGVGVAGSSLTGVTALGS